MELETVNKTNRLGHILINMSRRASLYAKQNPGKERPKVHFPDELVFLDNIKENDIQGLNHMLRRASLQVDISGINDAGMYRDEVKRHFVYKVYCLVPCITHTCVRLTEIHAIYTC